MEYNFTKFGEDKKYYPVEKFENSEYNQKLKVGEQYLQLLKQNGNKPQINNNKFTNSSLEKEMKENFPDPKEMPQFKENTNFNSNNYSKPEIYYSYQHDEFILPSDPNHKSGKDMSIKALQDLQNNFENSKYEQNVKTSDTYANQLDKFIRKYPGLK